jgi:hypothetical protein
MQLILDFARGAAVDMSSERQPAPGPDAFKWYRCAACAPEATQREKRQHGYGQ